jgi:anti-sigma regulatory factor (Ser/Thr protein kinase)
VAAVRWTSSAIESVRVSRASTGEWQAYVGRDQRPADEGSSDPHIELQLPARGWSLNAARTAVRNALTTWGLGNPEKLHLTELVATELVSNVVRHVGDDFTLRISADGATITLEVHDPSPAIPIRRTPDRHGGRGLAIVEAVSASWGFDRFRGDGKRVWARLDFP